MLHINKYDVLEIVTELDDPNYISNLYNTLYMGYIHCKKHSFKVLRWSVGHDLNVWEEKIEGCLNTQRTIPSELDQNVDLGLYWNNHTQKIILAEEAGHPLKTWNWPGSFLLFLENKGDGFNSSMTFLYNDHNGNIILQVSSAYPWFFQDAPSPELNISYDDWLHQYKILYKTIISQQTAQLWAQQLKNFYAKLEANMPKEFK